MILFGYDSLAAFIETNFELKQLGYSRDEVFTMIPWERQVEIQLIKQKQKQESEYAKDQANLMKDINTAMARKR